MIAKYEYFLEIVKQSSISKAAENLYISQPSLSQYLNHLETELGTKLFDRKKLPLKLTYAGEKYLNYVKEEIRLKKQLHLELRGIETGMKGKVVVGIHLTLGTSILADLLPYFSSQYPGIEIVLDEGVSTAYLQDKIENDEIDCGLIYLDPLYHVSYFEPLIQARTLLVCSKEHPFAKNKVTDIQHPLPIQLEEIQEEKFIVLKSNQYNRKVIDNLFRRLKLNMENYFETANPLTALALAASNMGFTFIPEIYIKHNVNMERLAYFTIKNYPLDWWLYIVYNKSGLISPATKRFAEAAKIFYTEKYH